MSKNLGRWISESTVTGQQIRLNNDQFLRSRNALDTADVNLLKGNVADQAEFGAEPVSPFSPSSPNSLVNRQFVEDVIAGIRDPKDAVRLASQTLPAFTAAGTGVGKTLTADANGALDMDGITPSMGDRVAFIPQLGSVDAGVYVVTQVGDGSTPWILTRSSDADENPEVTQGLSFDVVEGLSFGRTRWLLTNATVDIDVTSLVFVETPMAVAQVQFKEEKFTIDSTILSDGFVELSQNAEAGSITIYPKGGPVQVEGAANDYTISVPSTVTRVTFTATGDLTDCLIVGDLLVVRYAHF